MTINKRSLRLWILSGIFFIAIMIRIAIIYHQDITIQAFNWYTNWPWILLSIALMTLGWLLAAWVWSDIMVKLGSRLPPSTHIRYHCITQLSRRIPGKIWFLAGRGYLYQQHGEPLRVMAVASAIEWFILVLSGGIITLVTINFSPIHYISNQQEIFLSITILLAFFLMQPRVVQWLIHKAKILDVTYISYWQWLKWLGFYGFLWLIGGTILYIFAYIITEIPMIYFSYVISIWSLVGALSLLLIVLPTNLGFSDAGISFLLALVLPTSSAIIIAASLYFIFLIYEGIATAIIMMGLLFLKRYKMAAINR